MTKNEIPVKRLIFKLRIAVSIPPMVVKHESSNRYLLFLDFVILPPAFEGIIYWDSTSLPA